MFFAAAWCHNAGMQVTIDKDGRIELPRPVRDRLGLTEDTTLELTESQDGIVLKRLEQPSRLLRRDNGRLVITGETGDIDWDHPVQQDREERIRKIGNW